jgi:hypothetical protein
MGFFKNILNFFSKTEPVQDVEFFQRMPPPPPDDPNPQEFDDFLDDQEKKNGDLGEAKP